MTVSRHATIADTPASISTILPKPEPVPEDSFCCPPAMVRMVCRAALIIALLASMAARNLLSHFRPVNRANRLPSRTVSTAQYCVAYSIQAAAFSECFACCLQGSSQRSSNRHTRSSIIAHPTICPGETLITTSRANMTSISSIQYLQSISS